MRKSSKANINTMFVLENSFSVLQLVVDDVYKHVFQNSFKSKSCVRIFYFNHNKL